MCTRILTFLAVSLLFSIFRFHSVNHCVSNPNFFNAYIGEDGMPLQGKAVGSGSYSNVYLITWRGADGKNNVAIDAVLKISTNKNDLSIEKEADVLHKLHFKTSNKHILKMYDCFVSPKKSTISFSSMCQKASSLLLRAPIVTTRA